MCRFHQGLGGSWSLTSRVFTPVQAALSAMKFNQ